MENGFSVSLSNLTSLRRQMDVIANNLANMNTGGFKAEQVLFEEYVAPVAQGAKPAQNVSFVLDYGVKRDFAPGNISPTGNALHVALGGKGFFAVEYKDGIGYTRSGNFTLNNEGDLVTQAGFRVLDEDLNPIALDPENAMPDISTNGAISIEGDDPKQLAVVDFLNPQALKKAGANVYTSDEEATQVEQKDILIQQGYLEDSNVEPILEITRMIDVMRRYQSAKGLIDTGDDLTTKVIDQLSQIR